MQFVNVCGKYAIYEIYCEYSPEVSYEVRCVHTEEPEEPDEDDYEDEEMEEYAADDDGGGEYVPASEWHERALPYLQEMVDGAKGDFGAIVMMRDELEVFGDPHYSPLPWPVEPLPPGAIY